LRKIENLAKIKNSIFIQKILLNIHSDSKFIQKSLLKVKAFEYTMSLSLQWLTIFTDIDSK